AIKLSEVASIYINNVLNIDSKFLPIVSLVIVFLVVLIGFRAISGLVENLINAVQLGFVNRIAGGVLWAGLAALLVSTLVWYLDGMGMFTDEVKLSSKTYAMLTELAPEVISGVGVLVPLIQDSFDKLELFFDELADKAAARASE
ncbi:MAG: membrane protein required for colicin V production, partial [Limisphaerales bacterium]